MDLTWIVFKGPVWSGFFSLFGKDQDRTGLGNSKILTWPDWTVTNWSPLVFHQSKTGLWPLFEGLVFLLLFFLRYVLLIVTICVILGYRCTSDTTLMSQCGMHASTLPPTTSFRTSLASMTTKTTSDWYGRHRVNRDSGNQDNVTVGKSHYPQNLL